MDALDWQVGTQFASKVMTALDALGVPYRVVYVEFTELKKKLAPPHTVPQMLWHGDLLTDSAEILKRVDQDAVDAPFKLYPPEQRNKIEELEQYAGSKFNAHVLYFTWWVERGFQETVVKYVSARWWPLPTFLTAFLLSLTIDVGRVRGAARKKARGVLGEELISRGRDPPADEDYKVKMSLLQQLLDLDACFESDAQLWICKTEHPSAADFALYGMVERLVGNNGDCGMGVVCPWLWEEANASRLQQWYARMHEAFPIQFLGKDAECRVWPKKL